MNEFICIDCGLKFLVHHGRPELCVKCALAAIGVKYVHPETCKGCCCCCGRHCPDERGTLCGQSPCKNGQDLTQKR